METRTSAAHPQQQQTIGDAQQITLLNAHNNMHSHMVAWWLRDSMTTLCLASHCAFIASRHIRNTIVLVNSLIDANTDGVIYDVGLGKGI